MKNNKVNTRAKKVLLFLCALVLPHLTPLAAYASDPFPHGRAMASQGAIVETEGVSGRQPWISAAYYRDTLRWGASAAVVSYHGGGAAGRYAFGGFAAFDAGPFGDGTARGDGARGGGFFGPIVCKASIAHLDAMGIYYEQDAVLSAGTSWRYLSLGLDAHVRRIGLRGSGADRRTAAALGATLYAQTRRIGAGISVAGLTASSGGDPYADPVQTVSLRVCTVRNRYGSQGAAFTVTPSDAAPLRFILAQEYRIGDAFALSASIASNPTTIGFGITIDMLPTAAAAAAVNHPFLGWSKGVSLDYGW